MAFEKKANPKDPNFKEVVIGQSAAALKRGVAAITESLEGINQLSERADTLSLDISNKEGKIKALDIEQENRERQMDIDLNLRAKENTEKVALEHLASTNRTALPTTELNKIKQDLTKLQTEYNNDVAAKVHDANQQAKRDFDNERNLLNAQHREKEATNVAEISGLKFQNTQLQTQVNMLVGQLDAERAAGVQRQQGVQAPTINVGGKG